MDLIVRDRSTRLELRMTTMNTRTQHTPLFRQRQLASYNSMAEWTHIQTLHLYKTESPLDGVQDMPYQYLKNLPPMVHLEQVVISVLGGAGSAAGSAAATGSGVLDNYNDEFYHSVGEFVASHPGTLSRLKLFASKDSLPTSLSGLVPALERVSWFELSCGSCGRLDHMSWIPILYDLADLVGNCHSLQRFSCHTTNASQRYKEAICHLSSRFPRLKHVQFLSITQQYRRSKTSVFAPIRNMVRASTSIEVIDGWQRSINAQLQEELEAVIAMECRTNRIQNCIHCFHENGVLTASLPSSLWPLILHKHSAEMQPDVSFYLLQQVHAAIIPTG
jgi:hypothetical protein